MTLPPRNERQRLVREHPQRSEHARRYLLRQTPSLRLRDQKLSRRHHQTLIVCCRQPRTMRSPQRGLTATKSVRDVEMLKMLKRQKRWPGFYILAEITAT